MLNENSNIDNTHDIQSNIEYRIFDSVKIENYSDEHYIASYISTSNFQWITGEDIKNFLPINSLTKEIIKQRLDKGHDVFIRKDWNQESNEVLPVHVSYAERPNLQNYLRRIVSFVNGFIQAPMANTNAAVIYGFNVLNNKFIENGFVFSEQNRSLKYIDIMDRAEELESQEPNGPELSEELMKDLEKYIEYRNILDRTYFIWNLKEELLDKLKELAKYQVQSATSIHLININRQDKTHSFELKRNVLSFIDENEHEQVIDLDFKKETSVETEGIDLILHNEIKEVFEREFKDEQGLKRKYSEFMDSIGILFDKEESTKTQTETQIETQTIQEANATILNFCTILTIFLTKINEHHRKKEMDQLVKEFTTKVNTLNMTL